MGLPGRQLFWRESMRKFDAEIKDLEVCEWATYVRQYSNVTAFQICGVFEDGLQCSKPPQHD